MANTFLKAKGIEIGSSLFEKSMLQTAKEFIDKFSEKILLPEDIIVENKNTKKMKLNHWIQFVRTMSFWILGQKQD